MAAVSRAEYLKRYLSGDDASERPSKAKPKTRLKHKRVENREGVRIIDDDVDWRLPADADDVKKAEEEEEEVPLVAEFVDERPVHLQRIEEFRTNTKWKLLGKDDSDENATVENPRQRHDTDSDSDSRCGLQGAVIRKSPDNSNRHDSDSDSEHEQKTINKRKDSKWNSDSDASPPRKGRERERSKGGREIPEKSGHAKVVEKTGKPLPKHGSNWDDSNSDSDLSPPKKGRKEDPAEPRNVGKTCRRNEENDGKTSRKHLSRTPDSDSDLSPAKRRRPEDSGKSRKRTGRVGENARMGQRCTESQQNSDSDMSPPKRRRPQDSGRSQKKTGRVGENARMGQRCTESQQDSDMSPPKRRRPQDSGRSQKKTGRVGEGAGKSLNRAESNEDSDSDLSIPDRNANGNNSPPSRMPQAGLIPVSDLRKERERDRKLREAEETNILKLHEASQEASTVFRDRQGRVRDLQQEKLVKDQEAAEEQKRKEKYRTWGHGLAQVEAEQRSRDDAEHTASQPLARYRDDAELDSMLRARIRDGDPMAKLLSRPDKSDKPGQAAKPRYSGPAPEPNRYNIWPGHRWDGVDRSNGFEKKRYVHISERKARNLEAHKWSVQDM